MKYIIFYKENCVPTSNWMQDPTAHYKTFLVFNVKPELYICILQFFHITHEILYFFKENFVPTPNSFELFLYIRHKYQTYGEESNLKV